MRFRARPVQKRFQHRSIRSLATRAAMQAAQQRAMLLHEAFTKALAEMRAALPPEQALMALLQRGWAPVLNELPWQVFTQTFGTDIGQALAQVMEASARAAAVHEPWKANAPAGSGPLNASFTVRFDLSNPRAVRAAQSHAAALVRDVSTDMRGAIRRIIVAGQRGELDIREQARSLRSFIGLTEQQSQAVMNFQNTLLANGDPQAVVKTQAYYDRSIAVRAQTIARTESIWASNAGQQELWAQATDAGYLDPNQEQEWITQPESNSGPCPICEPMDGQRRPLGEEFVSPYNGQRALHPPMHPRCVCALALAGSEN